MLPSDRSYYRLVDNDAGSDSAALHRGQASATTNSHGPGGGAQPRWARENNLPHWNSCDTLQQLLTMGRQQLPQGLFTRSPDQLRIDFSQLIRKVLFAGQLQHPRQQAFISLAIRQCNPPGINKNLAQSG